MSIFSTLLEMREAGASDAEQVAWLEAQGGCRADERRYTCRFCQDTGHLDVVHYRFVQDFQRGGRERAETSIYRVASIRCSCARGSRGEKDPSATYRPEVHCRVIGGDTTSAAFWAGFETWHSDAAEASREAIERRHEWNPEPRQREAFA